jgi:uncharacterized protein (TIRG00374 family)
MSSQTSILHRLRSLWPWLKWPVALGLLAGVFLWNRKELIDLGSRDLNKSYLLLALVLCGGSVVLTFYRWYLLVWAQEFPFTFRDALRLGFIGYLFNYFGPGAAGGDLFKAAMIAAEQKSRRAIAAATVVLDRILGMLALFMVGALATLGQPASLLSHATIRLIVVLVWAGAVGGSVALALMLYPGFTRSPWVRWCSQLPKVGKLIRDLVDALALYQTRRLVLLSTVVISALGHFGMLSCFYFCARAIQSPAAPGYWAHLMLIPGAELFAVVLPLPGGVGALEAAVGTLYQFANEARDMPEPATAAMAAGVATALVYRGITIIVAAVGAGYYLIARGEVDRVTREIAEASKLDQADQPADSSAPR